MEPSPLLNSGDILDLSKVSLEKVGQNSSDNLEDLEAGWGEVVTVDQLKSRATEALRKGSPRIALNLLSTALQASKLVETEGLDVRGALAVLQGQILLNLAFAQLKLGHNDDCVSTCTEVLRNCPLQPAQRTKAFYRRATALGLLAKQHGDRGEGLRLLTLARNDSYNAQKLLPNDPGVSKLAAKITNRLLEAEKEARNNAVAKTAILPMQKKMSKETAVSLPEIPSCLPAISAFFSDDAVPVAMAQTSLFGRHLIAKRNIEHGELVLACDAWAVVPVEERVSSKLHSFCEAKDISSLQHRVLTRISELEVNLDGEVDLAYALTEDAGPSYHSNTGEIALAGLGGSDKESLRLAVASLCRRRSKLLSNAVGEGIYRPLQWIDILELESHASHFIVKETGRVLRKEEWAAQLRSAKLLRKAFRDVSAESLQDLPSDEDLVRLLLRIRYNAFPILDRHRKSKLAVGMFPAASYLNHSCKPNAVVSHMWISNNEAESDCNGAFKLIVRAATSISKGEIISCNYIQLYQPFEERVRLLKEGFFITRISPRPNDELIVAGENGKGVANPESVLFVSERLDRGLKLLACGEFAGALQCLVEIETSPEMARLHRCHHLRFDMSMALISAARAAYSEVGAVKVCVKHSMLAIQAWETVVGVATPELAALYMVHSRSLQMLADSERDEKQASGMREQCSAALKAAAKIYTATLGEDHPLANIASA